MTVAQVADWIRKAKQQPFLDIWPRYDIRDIPYVVYDDQDIAYIDHPTPPLESPKQLMAATSVSINGVETATIPAAMCDDEITALAIAYHEGFHVFQHHHFSRTPVEMFKAMSFYPDLDAEYRAICRLEEHTLHHPTWTPEQKLGALKQLVIRRRAVLDIHPSLLNYERFLEINEGTASFVEQRTRQHLTGLAPLWEEAGHGWGRFYKVGSAMCWLFEQTLPNWTTHLEAGLSPSDLIHQADAPAIDLDDLPYQAILSREVEAIQRQREQIQPFLEALNAPDVIRIRYGDVSPQYRAFHPQTLLSLGDGRILHTSHFKLLLPSNGSVSVTQAPAIDHVQAGEIIFANVSVTLTDGVLRAETESVQIDLRGVTQLSEHVFGVNPAI